MAQMMVERPTTMNHILPATTVSGEGEGELIQDKNLCKHEVLSALLAMFYTYLMEAKKNLTDTDRDRFAWVSVRKECTHQGMRTGGSRVWGGGKKEGSLC